MSISSKVKNALSEGRLPLNSDKKYLFTGLKSTASVIAQMMGSKNGFNKNINAILAATRKVKKNTFLTTVILY